MKVLNTDSDPSCVHCKEGASDQQNPVAVMLLMFILYSSVVRVCLGRNMCSNINMLREGTVGFLLLTLSRPWGGEGPFRPYRTLTVRISQIRKARTTKLDDFS